MDIYPAIDIKDGKCVRLQQGDMNKATVYNEVPSKAAVKWQKLGATCLHVVDLNGAFNGRPSNMKVVEDIISSVEIPVRLGGGIRDLGTIGYLLDLGIHSVILGTAALKDAVFVRHAVEKYASRIVIGIDARDGLVAVDGWQRTSSVNALLFAQHMEDLGVKTVIFTDIWRDGMLTGPNFSSISEMVQNTSLSVIASGGISQPEHLIRLKQIGVSGAVVGKALYTGAINLGEALDMLKEDN
jgi:phosphoribosylformimino-5-aminoimidazole carboxamide ribotide isomerase